MNVAFLTSEVEPLSKTGGLADVSKALPQALSELGAEVTLFTPRYGAVSRASLERERAWVHDELPVIGRAEFSRAIISRRLPVVLVESARYFERDGIYGDRQGEFPDNLERYTFFCRAVLGWLSRNAAEIDIIHCNDWQTALVPVFLRENADEYGPLARVPVLITVHNLGYQGIFTADRYPVLALPARAPIVEKLEFFGRLNLLKGGLIYSDFITTVSETYSREILTPEGGFGLDGVLRDRSRDLIGILNGVDTQAWNPRIDPLIAANYSEADPSGKVKCKSSLQAELGLNEDPGAPLLATISRLAEQKGIELIAGGLESILSRGAQFVLLGEGDRKYHEFFLDAAVSHPRRVSANLRFDPDLAHRIEAGADIFLMPSRYEPCGLNQMLSLAYGTIPVVRGTGGLEDSVRDYGSDPGTGNGFKFYPFEAGAFLDVVNLALDVYGEPKTWIDLVRRALASDFTWGNSARKYLNVYEKLMEKSRL